MAALPQKAGADEDAPPKNVIPLRLPDMDDDKQPGARFVRRAVGWTLGLLAGLVVVGLIVSALVKMDVTVKTAGTLEPVRIHPVRAMEGGAIREVLVATGDTVEAGEVVLRLDTLGLATQLAQLEAQHRTAEIDRRRSSSADPLERGQGAERAAAARARLNSSLAALRQRMIEYDLGTNLDSLLAAHRPGRHVALDQAVGEVRAAEAELRLSGQQIGMQDLTAFDRAKLDAQMDQLSAQIRATRERMNRLEVRAPIAGVVLTQDIEKLPGVVVAEGTPLLEIADPREWRVELRVSERDAHRIEIGDSVKVEVQAFDQDERELLGGRVVFVSEEPVSAAASGAAGAVAAPVVGAGQYRVLASLDRRQLENGGEKFRRGYTVQGNVITRSGRILTLLWNYLTEKLS
ncbi:MAG TPA: HlyD family efflux transporter periplasmic adaptor subunit [Longimicrobium sp.]|nr:HlyD family efflux transporter periplasmic adaptor subunit [Longimicrobium sp.]